MNLCRRFIIADRGELYKPLNGENFLSVFGLIVPRFPSARIGQDRNSRATRICFPSRPAVIMSSLYDFLLHRGAVFELKDHFVKGKNDYPVNNRVPQILVKFSYEALVRQLL